MTSTYYILYQIGIGQLSIINYVANLPDGVNSLQITEAEKLGIDEGTHYFDLATLTVQSKAAEILQAEQAAETLRLSNLQYRAFLDSTDWQVLRHIRQQSLGIETSLTQQEYLDLEEQRHQAALSIIQ
jgi:hypothetical protein